MPELSPHVLAAKRLHTDALLQRPNVVGVGVGTKRKGGASTGEPAVVVFVTRKLPREALGPQELIPGAVASPEEEEVTTDVVEVGVPRFAAVDTATYRPLLGGSQIGNALGGAGTAGAIMYDRRDQQRVLLTNNHVLTNMVNPSSLPDNTTVFQPAGGPRVGNSKRIVPFFRAPLGEFSYNWFAQVDAGIVAIDGGVTSDFEVTEVGRHPFVVLPPYEGLEVVRRGFRTQLRHGTVEHVRITIVITAPNGARVKVGDTDEVFSIRSRPFEIAAMPGDSGSLVVDENGGASRGLVFGTNNQTAGLTWACELGAVMSALELDTPCSGSLNALIRRGVYRRLHDNWDLVAHAAAAGGIEGIVQEQIELVRRLRHGYLNAGMEGSNGQALGMALERLAPALATAIANDEDAAGWLDRAFGGLLVQPTVFDMLEYRFDEEAQAAMVQAFGYLQQAGVDRNDLDALAGVFVHGSGRSLRDMVNERAPQTNGQPSTAF